MKIYYKVVGNVCKSKIEQIHKHLKEEYPIRCHQEIEYIDHAIQSDEDSLSVCEKKSKADRICIYLSNIDSGIITQYDEKTENMFMNAKYTDVVISYREELSVHKIPWRI